MNASRRYHLGCASAAAIILGMAWTVPAAAQDAAGAAAESQASRAPAGDPGQNSDAPAKQEDIIVTGTNISGVKPVGSETVTVNRDQILATGLTNLNDVLQTIPQVQNNPNAGGSGPVYRQGGTAGYGGNSTQGTAINLRGLGTSATLTLIDGRRVVPSGAASTFTESIQVPIAAIERVEVVTDGNSAIYGSDAISGVVNYVLRKQFNGIEISGRDTFDRFHNNWGASITAGHSWGTGNIIVTYDYDSRQPFVNGKSKFLRRNLAPLGGRDVRALDATIAVSTPTLIVGGNGVPYSYYTIPNGAGPGTTFAQLTPGANLVDSSYYADYLGSQKRHQASLIFNQDINQAISFFVESFYTKRDTLTGGYGNSRVNNIVTVCQGSPYYITGAPAAASASSSLCGGALGQQIAVDPVKFFNGRSITANPDETISVTGGFTGRIPGNWRIDTYFTYAHDSTCGICNYDNNANGAALAAQIVAGNINPFGNGPLTSAQYATFMGSNTQLAYNTFYDAVIKLDGPLFALPAGSVRTAFGGELAYNRQHLINGSNNAFEIANPTNNNFAVTNDTTAHRSTASLFAELFVPLVADDMNVPLMRSLDIDAAVRYDGYSDFGSTTNPKIGATWVVNSAISIRGSWGTSFRAPALTDTNPQNFSAAVIGLPFANNSGRPDIGFLFPGNSSVYLILGANPDLRPETATTWSAGIDVKPVSGLKLSATYYNTRYSNQIVGQNTGLFLSNPANAALYSSYIIPVHNPVGCVNGAPSTYDPVLANFIAAHPALYNTNVVGACSVNVILDGRSANAATTFQDGLDFQASYAFETGFGNWILSANATKILNQTLQQVDGAATTDVLGTYYYPVSLRGRVQIGWSKNGFGANAFLNYVGSYKNTLPLTGQSQSKVPAWVTLDLGLSYAVPKGSSMLSGLRLSVNVQNVTNRDPPIVLTQSGNNYGAYDPSNANVFGRIVSLQVTKSF